MLRHEDCIEEDRGVVSKHYSGFMSKMAGLFRLTHRDSGGEAANDWLVLPAIPPTTPRKEEVWMSGRILSLLLPLLAFLSGALLARLYLRRQATRRSKLSLPLPPPQSGRFQVFYNNDLSAVPRQSRQPRGHPEMGA